MISPTPTRRLIRAVTVSLAAAALLAGCSATASSTSTGSGAGAASKDAWTTISTSVRTASTGASVTDVLAANDVFVDAFNTDVRPLLAELRESQGLDPDPMRAFLASGYLERIRSERVGGDAAGWGA